MVDKVATELMNDPGKRQMVQIIKFAKDYNITDPAAIRQRFAQVDPNIVSQALDRIIKGEAPKI